MINDDVGRNSSGGIVIIYWLDMNLDWLWGSREMANKDSSNGD
jgi:hypothetical protein